MTVSVQQLRAMIREDLPELVAFRRDLHAHPELQYEEVRTSQRVRDAALTPWYAAVPVA